MATSTFIWEEREVTRLEHGGTRTAEALGTLEIGSTGVTELDTNSTEGTVFD